jgi:NADH-quinone oxidoreductase subunit J
LLPELGGRADPISDLGLALVSPDAYIIPFELASVLLLAALIGAIVIAWKKS